MGNQPSSANHNKLSKPRTNTNSTSAALKVDSPTSVSSRYADLSAEGRQQIKDTLLSPVDTEFGSSVFARKDELAEQNTSARGRPLSVISRSNSRVNSRTNSRSNSISCFGSKHGSTAHLAGFSDSKMSLVSTSHVDLEAAIKLLQEVKKNASPEELAALHEILETSDDHPMPVNDQGGLSRRTSAVNRSSSSLTRRQSLIQTPGVGTRNSPVEGRRRTWNSWKAPKLEPDEEAKWQTSPKETSHLTPQAALSLTEDNRDSLMPRAQTPGEMDYSHLGSLRLGSLVVTNGAPSPAPSTKVSKLRHAEDDYFSATEAGTSPLMMKSTRRRGHVKSKSAALPSPSPLNAKERGDTILRSHANIEKDAGVNKTSTSLHTHASSTNEQSSKNLQMTNRNAAPLVHNAARFAQSYQAEIPTSPFLASEHTHKTEQDEGFVSDDTMASGVEATRSPQGTIFAEPQSRTDVMESTSPTSLSSSKQEPKGKASQRPPPRTVDSGYSSGSSLQMSDREQQESALSTRHSQGSSLPQSVLPMKGSRPADPSFTDDNAGNTFSVMQPETMAQFQSATKASTQAGRIPSSLMIPDHASRVSMQSPTSETLLSPQTPRSVASRASFDGKSSKTQKRNSRRRPSQAEPPVVQSCQPIPEGTIPDVPLSVRVKFERRLSNTPGVECLTHTYPSKDHIIVDEPTTDAPRQTPTGLMQLAELEAERPPTPPAQGRRRSLSIFRRKSTVGTSDNEKEGNTTPLGVVDLGTIATSLGTSPYDAAMPHATKKAVTSPTHPHQLGASLPRAKSMVGMDNQAAAEFARMQSRDRAMAEEDKPPQRRRSYHNLKMEVGEAKASKRRPQSSDIPPVPSIDTSKITTSQSALPRGKSESPQGSQQDLSFNARSRERGHRVSQIVGKYDRPAPQPSQQNVDWEAHSQAWSRRRKSIGEGLRSKNACTEASHSSVNSRNKPQAQDDIGSWGRFSGGLEYDYEGRGVGVGGSAGTRQTHSVASSKSMQFKHQYGVDLSDVPIMLQRI